MNTNRSLVLAVIATTLLCAALVWSNIVSAGHIRELREQLQTKETEFQKLGSTDNSTQKPDTGLAEMLAQRDAEYAKLRDDYDKLQQQLTNAVPVVATTTNTPGPRFGRGNGGSNAWLERLRLQDPERYKQMIAARDERQKRAEQQFQEQMTQLNNRIQTAPSQEEVDLATQIADTLDRYGQLRQQMQQYAGIPPDQLPPEAQALIAEMRDLRNQRDQLQTQDRTLQYNKLATQLGLNGQDAQTLAQSIPEILKSTQISLPGQGGPGGFRGLGGNGGNTAGGSASTTPAPQSSPSTTK